MIILFDFMAWSAPHKTRYDFQWGRMELLFEGVTTLPRSNVMTGWERGFLINTSTGE